ncbi:Soluble quinoprotein glucose dehydrogenase [Glarea lozoyensis ATCC 20868]|uniref:Soluble quinoprotein glucose dehydrogenase n=1 Tax=Glarea lozoyensis (strain ATCC 20868 / MF5171) TaxID=1116229 RepID=S3DVA7_GLAL2|nr:Soluble quinoprotein glucose dehydrogenase [Glarea lozoyensis ATCC 20868]EPE30303.1 Soluble quinoprotein glucose dehydrogenase [Glarea lozoyensis ATCC 20868]
MLHLTLSLIYALALVPGTFAIPSQQLHTRQQPFKSTPITTHAEPWAIAFLPDNRILVTERRGNLRLVDPTKKSTGTITGVPAVAYAGQGGLHDVALHPQYASNSLIYISYAESGSGGAGGAVARAKLTLDANGGGALSGLEVIWRHSQRATGGLQFACRLLFGADGALWIASGEINQMFPAQAMGGNLGKMVRLYDNGTAFAGNPFASQGAVQAQVWSLGHRNPLGIDLDAQGRLWEVEMGPMGGDELNLIQSGANYGWPLVSEGKHYNGTAIPAHSKRPDFAAPKAFWVPVISPAGLIIYKGDLFPSWKGNAIITGLSSQGLVRVAITGDTAKEAQRISMGKRMRGIREAKDGAIWVIEDGANGRLLKLTPN